MDSKEKMTTKEESKSASFGADIDQLDWIQLQKEMDLAVARPEGLKEKLIRKSTDNPFVPIGCLTTAGVLGYGLWCMRTGQPQKSQLMMRFRIAAQGFTVAALLLGITLGAMKQKTNH